MRGCIATWRSPPRAATDGALDLSHGFGLHPSLSFLHDRYSAGELLVFHAVASPYRDRSHFDGQNVLENGLTKPIGTADGWLNRALAALPGSGGERAVAVSQNVPLILRGDAPVMSKSPQNTPDVDEDLLARLADLYSKDNWFAARLSEAQETEKMTDSAAESRDRRRDRGHDAPRRQRIGSRRWRTWRRHSCAARAVPRSPCLSDRLGHARQSRRRQRRFGPATGRTRPGACHLVDGTRPAVAANRRDGGH